MNNLSIQLLACLLLLVCGVVVKSDSKSPTPASEALTVDTLAFTNPLLTYENGTYRYGELPFSGVVHRVLKGFAIESYTTVRDGRPHGAYRSFYASGKPYEVRTYQEGLSTGTHTGYWEDSGRKKFEYTYHDEQKEGPQRTWYANGDPAEAYTYHNDRLDGLQQAWRENGSLYRNFIVKNGIRYGLQKSKTCYEVSDGRLVVQADKPETEKPKLP